LTMTGRTPGRRRPAAPTIALVHDNFTGPTGMGLVLNQHARWVLDAGWQLCIVGENVPDALSASARVVPVRKPRGLPALPEHLEWCRRASSALRRVRADIVHVHSPLLAARADLQTAHFVSRPAFAHGVREAMNGLEGALRRIQTWATRKLDDGLYRHLQSRKYLSFVSEFLRDEFERYYGPPRGGWILSPPAPAWRPPERTERAQARAALGVPDGRLAVGYLGGADQRKGLHEALTLVEEPDLTVLIAGPGSERVVVGGRPGLGFVDVDSFLSACDVVAAPTLFDPAPVAVLQALSRGVPIVTGAASGWVNAIRQHRCGLIWQVGSMPLAEACRQAAESPTEHCRAFVDQFASGRQKEILIGAYEEILATEGRKRDRARGR
jgi:glycosyltransferase involved in cell wall biosynthesis